MKTVDELVKEQIGALVVQVIQLQAANAALQVDIERARAGRADLTLVPPPLVPPPLTDESMNFPASERET